MLCAKTGVDSLENEAVIRIVTVRAQRFEVGLIQEKSNQKLTEHVDLDTIVRISAKSGVDSITFDHVRNFRNEKAFTATLTAGLQDEKYSPSAQLHNSVKSDRIHSRFCRDPHNSV